MCIRDRLLFVVPPDADTLQKRLTGRGTETLDVIKKRLHRAVEETDYILKYDYLVVNDDIDECVEETLSLIHISCKPWRRNGGDLLEQK